MKTKNYFVKKSRTAFLLACMIVTLFATFNHAIAQTVLLSPTGDGGFENVTSSFAANNWLTALPGATRQWQVGTIAGSVSAGTKSAYVGAAANYNGANTAQVGHFYRDVAIPAGATNVLLSFYLRMPNVDNTFDYIRVFTTSTSNTPVSGTSPTTGYTMVFENTLTAYASFTAMTPIDITSWAGSTVRIVFTNVSDGVTPVANPAIDNVSVVYTPPPACSGTPNGGTTISSVNPVCSGVNFNLSLSGSSSGTGLIYQWQSSPNNSTWTNIGGATLATYSATQTSATYYRCQLNCGANPAGFSTSLLVNMNALANCYCIPVYGTGCANDRITNFLLNSLSNNSGATCSTSPAGYSQYGTTPSNLTTTLDQGGSYTATISTVAGNANGTGVAIWIDYNDNGTFDATERNDNGATKFTSNSTGTLIVNVPVTAPVGQHSMRVMSARNVNSNLLGACAPGNVNGETEDYIVTIAIATTCSGNPSAGATQSSANPACSGGNFTLSLNGATTLGGLAYQWQSSPDNTTWTNIVGATGGSYIANQTVATYYQCIVTCTNSGFSATSTSLLVTVTPIENCYCVGTYDFDCGIDYISNVTFGTINNTTTCSGSLPTNRSVYNTPNPVFYRGFSYPISITTDGDVEAMRAWIDYDHSFSFIAGESVLAAAAGGPPQTTTGNILIPNTAQLGQTMLRVRNRYSASVGTGAACTNFSSSDYGETEDYLITIADAPQCSGTPVAGATVSTVNAACPTTSFTLSLSGNAIEIGLTYQWQSAPDVNGTAGTYSNISGATATTYTTTLASITWYRCIVTCSNGGSSANSTPIKINTAICINISNGSSTTCSANFYDSGGPGGAYIEDEDYVYTFFPNPGNQTQIAWSSFASEQDYDFITIYNGPNTSSPVLYGPASGTLSIPTFTSTDPSGAITVHFTSDFITNGAGWYASVTCVPNPPCSGSPSASTTIASANPACYNTAFNLSLGSSYLLNGISYQWQSAPDVSGSPGTFTNIAGATLSTYAATQTNITWYHCVVTCSNSGLSTNSSNLRVTTQLCYCTPVYTTGCAADYISNFVLNTLSNNSGSTCSVSPPGYSIYAPTPINQTTTLSPGSSYTATITVATGNANGTGVAIWIDYNDNGVFDFSENNNNGATKFASNTTGTLVVNIPSNAAPGQHRLRVVSARNTNSNIVGACAPGNATGEAEDYTVTIGDPTASSNTPVCQGDTLHLFSIPSGATSYSWTGPNGFTSSQQNPSIAHATPAASGIYTVTIVVGSSTYSPTTTVVVNPSPLVSVTSNAPFCSATQNLNLQSNAPTAISYVWTGPSFNSTSANPSIASATNANSGTYKVVVTDNNSCRDSSTATLTIYSLPAIGITVIGNTNLCTGQTTSDLQATGAGASGTYSWSTTETTDLITVSGAGNYSVTGTDNHNCINSFNQLITESAAPAAPVVTPAGPVQLCYNSGGAIAISLTCNNYSNNLLWSTSETSSVISVDYPDIFNVTYTDPNGCYSVSNPVLINDDLAAPTITCPGDVVSCSTTPALGTPITADNCSVNSFFSDAPSVFQVGNTNVIWTVTDYNTNSATCVQVVTVNEAPQITCPGDINDGTTNPGGMTETYVAPSGGSPVVTATCTPASGSNFPIGTTVVNCSATNLCGTGTCSFNVNITLTCVAPVIGACPANITQCDNHVVTWTSPSATGTPAPAIDCLPASGSTFPTGITTVTCTATNVCGNDACSFTVTINETPVIGACPVDITTCNAVVTFTTPSSTGSPVPVVACSPASGSTFAIGLTPVTCTSTNSCGSSSCSFNVTVQTANVAATSATNNASFSEICLGGNVTLTANGGSLGTGAAWVWYEGGCGLGASVGSGASITITPAATGIHNYFVRAEGACGNTACQSTTVSVISSPPVNTIHFTTAQADGCVSAPAAAFSVNAVSNCTFYYWNSSTAGVLFNGNPGPFQTTVPTVNITFVSLPGAGNSGWSICVLGGNACGNTNTICTWVRSTLSAPTLLNGSVIGCPGSTSNAYSSATVNGAASYQWSATGGIIVNGNGTQSVSVDFPAGFVSGTISVHGQTSCGYNGPNKTISINKAPAIPGTIAGPSYPCPNASASYSVATVPGAVNYTWTTSVPGALVTGTTNSCSILFPAAIPGGSIVSVTANSSCPTSSPVRSKGIASGIPGVPASITGPASGQCGQSGVSYSISPMALATGYNWNVTCGSIVGPTNLSGVSIDWPASFTSCTLSVSATNNCGTGSARILGVTGAPAIPPAISGNVAPCANAVESYSTSGSIGATSYAWTVPAGASILGPVDGASIIVQWGVTGGNITARASNTCGISGARSLPCVISCRMSQVQSAAGSFNVELFPNPVSNKATLKFNAALASQYHLNMTDVVGQSVLSLDGTATEGINMIELNLGSLAKGVYMLSVLNNGSNEQIRVVVQ